VNPGDKTAEAKFKEINEANEVLSDPEKRRKYDELGSNWRAYEQPGGAANPNAGAGGFRNMTAEEARSIFAEGDPFSDFFHTFFGGGAGEAEDDPGRRARGRSRSARQGRDVEQEIELSLEDAFHGTTRRFAIKHSGHARTVDVRIPPGVGDGSRVRIAGEGEIGAGGAKSGDLYLRIRLASHPTFERKGKDLYTKVHIPLTTAVLGGEAEVPTLVGKMLRLKVPATTQNAQTFRLKGHGMPTTNKPESGDLYATVEVQLPTTLTPEQRTHFEALAALEKGTPS
jgi:DnaJ-class molecular chaperone